MAKTTVNKKPCERSSLKRASQYDSKLKIIETLDEGLRVSISGNNVDRGFQ